MGKRGEGIFARRKKELDSIRFLLLPPTVVDKIDLLLLPASFPIPEMLNKCRAEGKKNIRTAPPFFPNNYKGFFLMKRARAPKIPASISLPVYICSVDLIVPFGAQSE